MKSIVAIGMLLFVLAFCNLLGRRNSNNANANNPPGTVSEENSNSPPAPQASPAEETESPPDTSARNSNTAAPPVSAAPGVRMLPGANQNSAASAPPAPKTISGGVLNGKAISLPKPAYQPIAKGANVSGTVNVQVLVDESGNVISARAISGHPLLKSSAESAARQARFRPTMISGQPVKVSGVILYDFVAQ